METALITEHLYPILAAQEACGLHAYHGWMYHAAFNASWRAAKARKEGDAARAEREQATRAALVPYPWYDWQRQKAIRQQKTTPLG